MMIKVHGKTQSHSIQSTGTILQSLEQHHVEHLSHCKAGFCGACRMKLKSGSVTYVSDPIGFHRKGEILPCVCIPDGEVEIEC
jgi:ferredoxin